MYEPRNAKAHPQVSRNEHQDTKKLTPSVKNKKS